jgi:hypothetical protein
VTTPTQAPLFATRCSIEHCQQEALNDNPLCREHWKSTPERLRIRLALAKQELTRAQSPRAVETARRAVDVARQACVQAVQP